MTTFTEAHKIAVEAAKKAAEEYLKTNGEHFMCGFAWVSIKADGRKPIAKEILQNSGWEKSWQKGVLTMWNPSGHGTQNIDIKEAGAEAYAKVMRDNGFNVHAYSRLD